MMKRKIKRIIVRLSVFCAVFFSLAVGFGLSYIRERDAGILYKNVNDGRAYASLCEYMISMGNVLRRIEGLQHENKYILAVEYSYLAGGAKAILASLPFEESARKRLQTYFSESDGYIRSLISDKIDDEINIDIISGYISYNDKISKKLLKSTKKSEHWDLKQNPPSFRSTLRPHILKIRPPKPGANMSQPPLIK